VAVRITGEVVKPLLARSLDTRGDLLEQLSFRIELFGHPRIMATAERLNIDDKGRPTKLASSKAGGSPRRLATIVAQLKLTYDLRGASADQVIGLLPREFATYVAEVVGDEAKAAQSAEAIWRAR
jgi:hypothetical protein